MPSGHKEGLSPAALRTGRSRDAGEGEGTGLCCGLALKGTVAPVTTETPATDGAVGRDTKCPGCGAGARSRADPAAEARGPCDYIQDT